MGRAFLIALLLLLVVNSALSAWRWHAVYSEAEKRFPIAQEFAGRLTERLTATARREVELADIQALLAEERFASLRDRSFVPSSGSGTLVILRINDTHDFPIAPDGTVSWKMRP